MTTIALLCGREFSFPPAFLERVYALGTRDRISAEFVKLGGTKMGEPARYPVCVRRPTPSVDYSLDWDSLLDYVGRPAILKPFSGGGWKHVYKVSNREELIAAYDQTSPYCMTLQEFIDFDRYVRCFTFGKTDITPVHYDPKERRYIVDHKYLSAELGARISRDAQTINLALGYEMNTIEFA